MKKVIEFLRARLAEPSTRLAIVTVVCFAGLQVAPEVLDSALQVLLLLVNGFYAIKPDA